MNSDPSKLDHTPLTFGKYAGMTPDHISRLGKTGENYIRWMYREVKNKPTCSEALYRACGGASSAAAASREVVDNMHLKNNFDSYDGKEDDIPF